jgi:glutathione synthase/RimK-type ligase-like ATP-grasp enzyme
MLILLWGLSGESPLSAVHTELNRLGIPTVFLDQRDILDTEIDLCVGKQIQGTIRSRNQTIDLSAVTAVYLRPYASRCLPQVAKAGTNSPAWRHAIAIDEALLSWLEMTPALVVSRPAAMAPNNSKPYQLLQIRELGFSVPETLVTTDPSAVQAFWERHGNVIYKSISGIRSQVLRLGADHVERLANVSWCPTQFQQYIPGRDYRVHVVGTEVFACEVISDADDYRYTAQDATPAELRSYSLPLDVEAQCQKLATALHLPVAGIDLRCTPSGEWYCFEVNPAPGFTYYQQATGHPISSAIAILLASGIANFTILPQQASGSCSPLSQPEI